MASDVSWNGFGLTNAETKILLDKSLRRYWYVLLVRTRINNSETQMTASFLKEGQ